MRAVKKLLMIALALSLGSRACAKDFINALIAVSAGTVAYRATEPKTATPIPPRDEWAVSGRGWESDGFSGDAYQMKATSETSDMMRAIVKGKPEDKGVLESPYIRTIHDGNGLENDPGKR